MKFKSIRPKYCKCIPDKVCYECAHYTIRNGSRYLTTWNNAVRLHNEEVSRGKKVRAR